MKIVSTGYSKTSEYADPEKWLERISFYTGILEQLAKKHDVVSIERINYEGDHKQQGVHYHFINWRKRVVRFPSQMHSFIKSLNPDIVLINGFIAPLQIIQLRMKLGGHVKIIVLHRAEKPFGGLKRYLQKLADKCVDAYLFSSFEMGKQWMEKGILPNHKKIFEVMQSSSVFNPVNKEQARSYMKITGNPLFLWVGRLEMNKDPLTVVKAFIEFSKIRNSARLYMIFQSEELLEEVNEIAQHSANIHLVGKVEHAELQNWYSSTDYFVSGSYYEGSGIALCEAMSCGCIPVVTDIISFRSITGRGNCGFLYEPGNQTELIAALLKTNKLDTGKERMKVLQQFKTELSFEAIGNKIESVIASI